MVELWALKIRGPGLDGYFRLVLFSKLTSPIVPPSGRARDFSALSLSVQESEWKEIYALFVSCIMPY